MLARFGGAAPGPQAEGAARIMGQAGLDRELVEDDEALWDAQRDGQRARGDEDTVVRVSAVQTDLPELLAIATRHSLPLVGRAPLGLHWLRIDEPGAVPGVLAELRRVATTAVLDSPPAVRAGVDPWGEREEALLTLMRRVKDGFDPAGACAPGVLV